MALFYITNIKLSDEGNGVEHIITYRIGGQNYGRAEVVAFVRNRENTIRSINAPNALLEIAVSSRGYEYVKTVGNSTTADNLLNLPPL